MKLDSGDSPAPATDALVVFGATGDLARKMIFPALHAMGVHGAQQVPVIGVASSKWSLEQLRTRARGSIAPGGCAAAAPALALTQLLAALRHVSGDDREAATFETLKAALQGARHPACYLAIPPALIATVMRGLKAAGLAAGARAIVEKPFGRDLVSERELHRVALDAFAEDDISRIDHFLRKEAIMNTLDFHFANAFLEPIWNRNPVASVHVTLAEQFGVEGCGAFDEGAGCLRDVMQNHLFQIVARLAMEPSASRDFEAVHRHKAFVFKAMRPLGTGDSVRAQYAGYRGEPRVAGDPREFSLLDEQTREQSPCERLLTDAMAGDGALFAREDAIEAAWAALEPVRVQHPPVLCYEAGTCCPPAANHFIAADGGWHNPEPV